MAYRDHYANYLEELQKDIEFCKATGCRVVFGYTSDLDIVFQYDETAYSCLLEEYLKEFPGYLPKIPLTACRIWPGSPPLICCRGTEARLT